MGNVFEDTGVKRYALRYRPDASKPWQYPAELQYDTQEEAQAAFGAMPVTKGYQIVEKLPCVQYRPVVAGGPFLSKLLLNMLAEADRKPFRLQWSNGRGWQDCPDRQFDTLAEAQEAVYGATVGMYRVMAATLEFRYEPVPQPPRGW